MTEWYLIDNEGHIRRTAYARTKREAAEVFGERGTVISALSWKYDYHRWQPVRTVTTDKVQVQQHSGGPKLTCGLLGTVQAAQHLGVTVRRLRYLSDRFAIQPERVAYGSRHIYAYTVSQLNALHACLFTTGGSDD